MKKAIQRFIRDDKGNAKVVLIDAQTLQPVVNPAEYTVINQTKLPYWEPVQDVATPDVPSKVQPPAQQLNRYIQQSGGDPNHPAVKSAVQTHAATMQPSNQPSVASSASSITSQPKTSVGAAPAPAHLAGTGVTNPLGVGSPKARPGFDMVDSFRAKLDTVDFDTLDIDPVAKEKAKEFQAAAREQGLNLAVDIKDMVRTPERQKEIQAAGFSKTKKSEHMAAIALDVSPIDVNDQKGWADKRALAEELGWGQLGSWDPAHMGLSKSNSLPGKLDISKEQAIKDRNYFGNVPVTNEQRKALGLQPNVGIPEARPAQPGDTVAQGIIGAAKDVASASIQGDPSKVSPAQMAGMGLKTHPRTPAEISRMAAAFAGELSPSQLEGLQNGDETARKELAGMISTAENRAVNAKSFDAVFDPGQYNSMMASKASVTKGNYAKYGPALRDAVAGFYTGALKPENYDVTSYYNPEISNPGWGIMNTGPYGLKDAQQVGDHTFGSVRDRGYHTTDLSGGANRPTEGPGHFGLGGLGSGLNSPSEGGSHFGGQGLGSPGISSDREGATSGPGLGLGGKSTSKGPSDKDQGSKSTGYGIGGTSGQSVGPSGGGKGWGGPH